jgi:hypothetical protein
MRNKTPFGETPHARWHIRFALNHAVYGARALSVQWGNVCRLTPDRLWSW